MPSTEIHRTKHPGQSPSAPNNSARARAGPSDLTEKIVIRPGRQSFGHPCLFSLAVNASFTSTASFMGRDDSPSPLGCNTHPSQPQYAMCHQAAPQLTSVEFHLHPKSTERFANSCRPMSHHPYNFRISISNMLVIPAIHPFRWVLRPDQGCIGTYRRLSVISWGGICVMYRHNNRFGRYIAVFPGGSALPSTLLRVVSIRSGALRWKDALAPTFVKDRAWREYAR